MKIPVLAPVVGLWVSFVAGGYAWAGQPAPVNPYNGMQEREDVFEFAQKPEVKRDGDKWIITFTYMATA